MNEGAVKLIRRSTFNIHNPLERARARRMLELAWKAGDHRERGRMRAMMLRSCK